MYIVSAGLMVCDIISTGVARTALDSDSSYVGETVLRSGGDAYNVAYHLASLGVDVRLFGCVGDDYFGEFVVEQAHAAGVDTSGVTAVADTATATSVILVEPSGERHFLYHPGANALFSMAYMDRDVIAGAAIVHLGSGFALPQMDTGGTEALFGLAHAHGALTSMDVTYDNAGAWLHKIEKVLPHTDLFAPSYEEARMISGCDDAEAIARFFQPYGIRYFVLKLGERGCYVTDYRRGEYIASLADEVVDTTGAGDCFMAGLLSRLSGGESLFESARYGQRAAARCVAHVGATGFSLDI